MLAAVAIPAFMIIIAPSGVASPLSMSCSVPASAALPANIRDRRTNPLLSSTRPRVISGQSERFSFERPLAALAFLAAVPAKYVLVRSYSVTVTGRANRSRMLVNSGMLLRRDEAGGEALRKSFDGVGFSQHAGLAGEQRVDTGAQARPVGLRQIEMAAEVEQGDLADLLAGALGGDETEGEIWLVTGLIPGCGFPNEHAVGRERGGVRRQESLIQLWHYKNSEENYGGFPRLFLISLR